MKVIYVITKANFGGAQRYVFDLASSLPKGEFEVFVVSGNKGLLTQKLESIGIRTESIGSLKRDISLVGEISSFFKLITIIKREKPDIVHLNSSKAAGLGALASRIVGVKKIIFTAHGWPFNEDRLSISRLVIKIISWLTVLFSHTTITINRADFGALQTWPFVNKKITFIPNGIPKLTFKTRSEARQKLGIPQDVFVVGSIGELTHNKNYTKLLNTVKLLNRSSQNLILSIIGDGEEHAKIEAQKKRDGLNNVILHGFVRDAYQYLKAYDIFVLPSFKEGLPYVLLEAGEAELPIVATNVGGIPDIIENQISGLLVKNDARDIADTVTKLMKDREMALGLARTLKEKVEYDFSLDTMIQETTALYKS